MKKIKVTEYNLSGENLGEALSGLSFVVVSDFHNNDFGIDANMAIEKIRSINPEFIIVAGDIVTARPEVTNVKAFEFIRELSRDHVIYYGNGNHEYRMRIYPETYGDMYQQFLDNISIKNVIHLVNDKVSIERNGKKINIRGLEIDRIYYKRFKKQSMPEGYIEELLGKPEEDAFEILIAHNPIYFNEYAKWGADLVFSGHVHGGLVRLPILGGVVSPDIKLFPKYDYGIYKQGKTKMILSSGLGAHTLKIRMFNPPEIVKVKL